MPAATSRPSNRHWASNRSVGRWLENLSSRISTHTDTPNTPLGISLGAGGAVNGSRTVRAGARPLVTSSPDPSAIRPNFDLDLFGILGVAGREGRTALRAHTLVFGQLAEIFDDGQVAVVPPLRTGPILPLASLARRGGVLIITLAFKVIRAIPGRRFFALSTEELILELAVLTAKLFDLGFEVLGPMHGPSVLSLPIPDLLPQFEILTPQIGDFLAQFEQLRDEVAAPVRTDQPARWPKVG